MTDLIEELLKKYHFQLDPKSNFYQHEIYADKNDELGDDVVLDILYSKDPFMSLSEIVEIMYIHYIMNIKKQIQREVDIALNSLSSTNLSAIEKHMYFIYPIEHYLQQKFKANIVVDTGDSKHDYTLNSNQNLDEKASLSWLIKQQGYSKEQLAYNIDNAFLLSVKEEIENVTSPMNALTFLVEMTLKDLIHINTLIRQKSSNSITISSNATAGLVDFWSGAGSLLEIQLERDVQLPIPLIRSILPDGGYGFHSLNDIYGLCPSFWQKGSAIT